MYMEMASSEGSYYRNEFTPINVSSPLIAELCQPSTQCIGTYWEHLRNKEKLLRWFFSEAIIRNVTRWFTKACNGHVTASQTDLLIITNTRQWVLKCNERIFYFAGYNIQVIWFMYCPTLREIGLSQWYIQKAVYGLLAKAWDHLLRSKLLRLVNDTPTTHWSLVTHVCVIPWICYKRSFSEFYLSIWNQLVFNQRLQLFVQSLQPYLLILPEETKCVFPTYW